MRALFAKFQVRYGARWTSPLDDDAMCALAIAEWAHGLAGLSGEDIRRGLDAWDGAWPPSLPEFRAACSKPKQHAAHQLHRALPPPKRDPVVVADEIAKMREEIRK